MKRLALVALASVVAGVVACSDDPVRPKDDAAAPSTSPSMDLTASLTDVQVEACTGILETASATTPSATLTLTDAQIATLCSSSAFAAALCRGLRAAQRNQLQPNVNLYIKLGPVEYRLSASEKRINTLCPVTST